MLNNNGDNTAPCLTPLATVKHSDNLFVQLTFLIHIHSSFQKVCVIVPIIDKTLFSETVNPLCYHSLS